jgi:hypothetical protein
MLCLAVFVPFYFWYSDPTDLNFVILVSDFWKIAQIEVNPKFVFTPEKRRLQIKAMSLPTPDPPPLSLKVQPVASDVWCNEDQCSLYYAVLTAIAFRNSLEGLGSVPLMSHPVSYWLG